MSNRTVIILAAWIFSWPVFLAAAETVTVKGMSFYEPGREAVAREKALDEAKRAAIELAVGTQIEARSLVEDFQVVKDQIFSRTTGLSEGLGCAGGKEVGAAPMK